MDAKIRSTTVTYSPEGDVVQLHISDAPPGDESASFVLTLLAKVGPYESPAVGHIQREAMKVASSVLERLIREMGLELIRQNYPEEPRPGKPRV